MILFAGSPCGKQNMPVVRDISLNLALDDVLRAQGIGDYDRLKPDMKSTIHDLLAIVSKDSLLGPVVVYETYRVAEVTDSHLAVEDHAAVLHGSLFHTVLAEAREIAVVVCTIGPKLEEEVAEHFAREEPLAGLLLDGIGTAAVESLCSEACYIIGREAARRGLQTGSPVSPGSPRFPISEQWELFKMVPAEDIGVSLSESGLMVPRKSLFVVVGMGSEMMTWTQAESCARCALSQTCRYRVRS